MKKNGSAILSKLMELVRAQGVSGTMRHLRVILLHRAHAVWDRWCRQSRVPDRTTGKIELTELNVESANRSAGVHYLPTPWSVLDWMHQALPAAGPQWSFVDLGAGKGRVLLSAAQRPYGRVIGVEFASELVDLAKKTVAADRALTARSVEVIHGDAANYDLPKTPLIIFMFNPFGPPVIERVAATIARSYDETPRPIVVAYLNPEYHRVFDALDQFDELKLAWPLAAMFRILSPYRLRLYATAEARC